MYDIDMEHIGGLKYLGNLKVYNVKSIQIQEYYNKLGKTKTILRNP